MVEKKNKFTNMFDIATKFAFSLDRKNQRGALKLFCLLYFLEKYVNSAEIEMRRLTRTRQSFKRRMEGAVKAKTLPKKNFKLTYLHADTHFYFICIDKAYKLIFALAKELKDIDIEKLATKLHKTFDIKAARGHLEHIEQRCLGRFPREDKRKVLKSDLGNFIGDNFSFAGQKFPSDKDSLLALKGIYIELIGILTRKYALKDPHFVRRLQSEERHRRTMLKLKKSGLI